MKLHFFMKNIQNLLRKGDPLILNIPFEALFSIPMIYQLSCDLMHSK